MGREREFQLCLSRFLQDRGLRQMEQLAKTGVKYSGSRIYQPAGLRDVFSPVCSEQLLSNLFKSPHCKIHTVGEMEDTQKGLQNAGSSAFHSQSKYS